LRIIEPFEVTLNSPASESRGPLVFNITGQIILSDPEDGCGPILNSNETFGKILIFYLGTCSIEEKMRYSQQVGIIVSNHILCSYYSVVLYYPINGSDQNWFKKNNLNNVNIIYYP
jgi:hypothetical protein